ncbi:branched-chain amino acid aminotransferase (plasmid) [Azospirillum sp. B510]|uniref:branched-chain amino acid aminotransferase n=2 Tax=Alphaproteobacteria TaxID=28211 RepID=UPI0001C4B84D|nr:branched-chain amino acid aminotransferase [Azospirillum sp. B510]BAI74122.1 branched-chain amino acid aminotransferase [Azospirillum sp. B510]
MDIHTLSHHRAGIGADLQARIDGITLPEDLGFGRIMAPVVAKAVFRDGAWEAPRLTALEPMGLYPETQALHYGQAIFEGMKAYRNLGEIFEAPALLFRPRDHARRFNRSAARLGMPEFPEDVYVDTLVRLVAHLDRLIPDAPGQSLYLRPFMFGATPSLSVVPSTEYVFLVCATPSDVFFTTPINAWIERGYCRAGPGGTGSIKAAGNYAASFPAAAKLQGNGFQQLLWLDAVERRKLEEFTAMNVAVRIGDRLLTPALTDTILPGITRDSLLRLATSFGMPMHEATIEIEEVLDAIRSGGDVELFGCGTGSVVAPVKTLGDESGLRLDLPSQRIAGMFRRKLLDIQHGLAPAPAGWQVPVAPIGA